MIKSLKLNTYLKVMYKEFKNRIKKKLHINKIQFFKINEI